MGTLEIQICSCGSGRAYEACCGALHKGTPASSPEALMRSRYTAYVLGNGRYLVDTTVAENRYEDDAALIEAHAQQSEWLGLEVLGSGGDGETGWVEFKAFYKETEMIRVLHEKSRFVCENGTWYYADGILYDTKIGRNDPCPCGSGRKYKKCCG